MSDTREPRRRGRRPLEPGTPTKQWTFQVPETLLDRVCVRALELECDVNEYIRRTLERSLAPVNKNHDKATVTRPGRY
jgi:hypothetical protein